MLNQTITNLIRAVVSILSKNFRSLLIVVDVRDPISVARLAVHPVLFLEELFTVSRRLRWGCKGSISFHYHQNFFKVFYA